MGRVLLVNGCKCSSPQAEMHVVGFQLFEKPGVLVFVREELLGCLVAPRCSQRHRQAQAGSHPCTGQSPCEAFLEFSEESLGRSLGQGTVEVGTAPSRRSFLYRQRGMGLCAGWLWRSAVPGPHQACRPLAAVMQQAVVQVFCLSPAFDSLDGEVGPMVPSRVSAGFSLAAQGDALPGAALVPLPLQPGHGEIHALCPHWGGFLVFGFLLSLGSAFSHIALIVRDPVVAALPLPQLCGLWGSRAQEHAQNLASCASSSRLFEQSLKIANPPFTACPLLPSDAGQFARPTSATQCCWQSRGDAEGAAALLGSPWTALRPGLPEALLHPAAAPAARRVPTDTRSAEATPEKPCGCSPVFLADRAFEKRWSEGACHLFFPTS